MDETYNKVKDEWMYLYKAVEKNSNTIDFLLTKRRNKYAADRFLIKAIKNIDCPKMITIDQSGANKEATRTNNTRCLKKIRIRKCKYLNNGIEQNHQFIKWRTQNMLHFKNFEPASRTLIGNEVIRMIKKGQIDGPMATSYKTLCSLAA